MSEIVERIEAATAKLAAQQQRIASSLASLEEMSHKFDGDLLHDTQEALPTLESSVRSLGTEIGKLPDHVEVVLAREIGAINATAEEAKGDLSVRWANLEKAQLELAEVLDALPEQMTAQLRVFPEILETHQERLVAANNELVAAIESANTSLEGAIAKQIEQSGQDLGTLLEQLHRYACEDLCRRAEGVAGKGEDLLRRVFGDVSQLAGRGGYELQRAAKAAIEALEEEILRGVNQKLPDAQRELIQHAVRALAKEIIEGITMSTVGAEVSAAMSPYLVYMIAVKEALELLLKAIEIFKNPIKEIF